MTNPVDWTRDPYSGEPCPWMLLPIPPRPEVIITVLGDEPAGCAPPGAAVIAADCFTDREEQWHKRRIP